MLLAERHESERLRQIIKELQRHRFGRRAETLPEEQMLLGLEDVEQVAASGEASEDESASEGRIARARKRRGNRGALPAHLPRIEVVVDIDDKICPCCRGELHRIGEDKSERLDMVPAQFRVLVTRRPKYACRSCEDGVLQAQAPARLIEGGLPTEATVAQVLVSKYADHLPLYRQAQIYARQGIELDRSTLADCGPGHAAWHLRATARTPASSGCHRQRPMPPTTGHGAADPPGVTRSSPSEVTSSLHSAWRLCRLSHATRNFYDLATPGPAPIASEALKRIAGFYAIEKDIRGRSAEERRLIRQQKSRPLADTFEQWLHAKLALISQKGKLAEAIRYALIALGGPDALH